MTRYAIIILILMAATIASCQKEQDASPNDEVSIVFNNPQNGQTFHAGDTVHINADVSYSSQLHGYQLKLTNTTTGTVLMNNEVHGHDDHFSIEEQWVDTLTTAASLKLELTVVVDHEGNMTTQEINFNNEL